MPVRSRIDSRPYKYVETVTTGSAEGAITITHNLGTEALTMYVRNTANDNLVMMPYKPLNDKQVEVETTYSPSITVEITITG